MPIGYVCKPEQSLVISAWLGRVDLDQWRANVERLLSDPLFPSTDKQLTDLRSATIDPAIGEPEIQSIVDFLAASPVSIHGRKVAILAGEEFPRSVIFERLIVSQQVMAAHFVFTKSACEWLGIDPTGVYKSLRDLQSSLL